MPDYKLKSGDIVFVAPADVDSFLKNNGDATLVEAKVEVPKKTVDPVVVDQETESKKNTGSNLEDGFSEPDPRRYIDITKKSNLTGSVKSKNRVYEDTYLNDFAGQEGFPSSFEEYVEQKGGKTKNIQTESFEGAGDKDAFVIKATKSQGRLDAENLQKKVAGVNEFSKRAAISTNYFNVDEIVDTRPMKYVKYGQDQDGKYGMQDYKRVSSEYGAGPASTGSGYNKVFVNTLEEDLKAGMGEAKFSEYTSIKEALTSQGRPLTKENIGELLNLNSVPQEQKDAIVNKSKKEVAEVTVDNEVDNQITTLRNLDISPEYSEAATKEFDDRTKDQSDYKKLTNTALVRETKLNGRIYKPLSKAGFTKLLNNEPSFIEDQADVLKSNSEEIIKEFEAIDTKNNIYKEKLSDIKSKIDRYAMPVVEGEFRNKVIGEKNALIEEYNNVLNSAGYKSIKPEFNKIVQNREQLVESSKLLNERVSRYTDSTVASNALMKNYQTMNAINYNLEEAFMAKPAMVGSSIALGIGKVARTIATQGNPREVPEWQMLNDLKALKGSAVDYGQRLRKEKERDLPMSIKSDNEYATMGDYIGSTIIDNSASILTSATMIPLGGLIGAVSAGRILQSVFAVMEGGGDMLDNEIAQKEAPAIIKDLEDAFLESTNEEEKLSILEDIEFQEKALNVTQFQKSLSAGLHAAAGYYGEKLGTFAFMKNFQKYSNSIGVNAFKSKVFPAIGRSVRKSVGAIKAQGIGAGVELIEETMTQFGQNFTKIAVMGDDISLGDGIDKDFRNSTIISSIAISGPMASQNIYSVIASEFASKKENKQNRALVAELQQIEASLQSDKLTQKARRLLRTAKRDKIKKLALNSGETILKLKDFSSSEVNGILDINQDIRRVMSQASELRAGGDTSTWSKSQLDQLKKEFVALENKRNNIFKNKDQEASELFKDSENSVDAVANYALFNYSKNLIGGQDGVKSLNFKDDTNKEGDVTKTAKDSYREYLEVLVLPAGEILTTEEITEYLEAAFPADGSVGVNAANVGNDVLLFEDNVVNTIGQSNSIEAMVAAVSPMHELGHIQARKAGIVKDDKLAGDGVKMVESIVSKVENLAESGVISKEVLKAFNDRIDLYRAEEKDSNQREESKGVNVDELIQLVNDFTNIGALPKSSFKEVYEIKRFVNSAYKLFNGDASMYFRFDDAESIFQFVSSWTSKAKKGTQIVDDEEDDSKNIKSSKSLQDLNNDLESLNEREDEFIEQADFEAQKSNLEFKIRKAKEKGVSKPVEKTSIDQEIENSADEVFKEEVVDPKKPTAVSEKNLEIADRNTKIENKILDLGANRLSDIKDEKLRKKISDALIKNNMGAVGELAKKSAFVGKSLNISEDAKVSYEDFLAGYNEQLIKLANSYKVEVENKEGGIDKIPFGAYAKSNLRLRYGDILKEAMRGKLENTSSMSDSRVQEAAESITDADGVETTSKPIAETKLTDVRKAPIVVRKNEDGAIDKAVDLEGVDIKSLNYKDTAEMFMDDMAQALLGISGDKASGKVTITSKKAGEIDNGAVTVMQDLFRSKEDVKSFLRVLPEFNVAPNQTTVNLQGESVDVSRDKKGVAIGLNKKIKNILYEKYIDPNSTKDKSNSITDPKGRSKGKTSQTSVVRLKPEYRNNISTEVINDFMAKLGLTPKGEARIPISGTARSEFGTTLQGATKIYLSNLINTVARENVVKQVEDNKDSASTTEEVVKLTNDTNQTLAGIGAGKSKLMFSKQAIKLQFDGMEGLIDSLIEGINSKEFEKIFVKNVNDTEVDKPLYDSLIEYFQKNKIKNLLNLQLKKISAELSGDYTFGNISEVGIERVIKAEGVVKTLKYILENTEEGLIRGNSYDTVQLLNQFVAEQLDTTTLEGVNEGREATEKVIAILVTKGFTGNEIKNMLSGVYGPSGIGGFKGKPGENKAGRAVPNGVILTEKDLGSININSKGKRENRGAFVISEADLAQNFLKGIEMGPSVSTRSDAFKKDFWVKSTSTYNKLKTNKAKKEYLQELQKAKTGYSDALITFIESIGEAGLSPAAQRNFIRLPFASMDGLGKITSAPRWMPALMNGTLLSHDDMIKLGFGRKDGKVDEGVFEHTKPANRMAIAAYIYSLTGKQADLNILKDELVDYDTAFITRGMDMDLTKNKLQSLMGLNYVRGEGVMGTRYMEMITDMAKKGVTFYDAKNDTLIDPSTVFSEVADVEKINEKVVTEEVKLVDGKVEASKSNNNQAPKIIKYSKPISNQQSIEMLAKTDKALDNARKIDAPIKKIRVFDFDDTLARTKSKVGYTMPDGTTGKIDAETFAKEAGTMEAEGATWDFAEFSKVMDGKKGPLFEVAKTIQDARGSEDIFVLTARPADAAGPIKEFLGSLGLDIPLKNITGLGDGSPQAKAGWLVGKAADGYNDFYFTDDAIGNVKAVKDALSVLDVKSKVQQAKIKFSKNLDIEFNKIIENKTGIAAEKNYAKVKAALVGKSKGRLNFFIPPSAEDFVGLLYSTLGKGKVGDSQMQWYKDSLLNPYARAMENITRDRNTLGSNFKALKKELKVVPRDLKKKIKGEVFTKEQAVRVYIWDQAGKEIPGISKADRKELTEMVESDAKLKVFAQEIMKLGKGREYIKPSETWTTGTITTDLIESLNTTGRKQYLEQWQQNADIIFSEKNLNKLEAAYGTPYRKAMENILKRMKSGRNRTFGGDTLTGRFTDWLNGSTAAIMFFNTRSAALQTISAINFINFGDNNVLAAGKAFANQPQYWSDFKKLFNSEFLVERRDGLKININEADIADVAKESGVRGVVNKLLKLGFTPTQLADSFAIASGGSTFYRNRLKSLVKDGMDPVAAEKQAMRDFRETAEESQQSSRPDKISSQQAGPLGRIVLAFANTPAQYARLMKKAASDLKNGRGDAKSNISKILYYGVAQNLLFNALQQALFAVSFGDEEEDKEELNDKQFRIINGMVDSVARGTGLGGAVFTVIKNAGIKIYDQSQKNNPKYEDAALELLKISPPISSKVQKIRSAGRTASWNMDDIKEKGFGLDSPAYLATGNVVSAATNVPLDRLVKKVNNLVAASDSEIETYKRFALIAGWSEWELGLTDKKKSKKTGRKGFGGKGFGGKGFGNKGF